jgi:predicted metalloprotease with PDZ domain
MTRLARAAATLALLTMVTAWMSVSAATQTHAPAATAAPPPGPITLNVDATDTARKLLHAHIVMPVKPGPLTLYYPKYIPGEHGPTGPVVDLAGLRFDVDGKAVPWHRDEVDMFTFHVTVPEGATKLDISLDFLSPVASGKFSGGVSMTPKLIDLSWNHVALYPAGYATKDLTYDVSLKLPKGWRYATALDVKGQDENEIQFQPVSFNNLVDSPLIAGEYFRQIDLAPDSDVHRYLDIVADYPKALDASDEQIKHMRNLVEQANALFKSHHYKEYHFLLTLSDKTAHFGLEHHQSSDNRTAAEYFINDKANMINASLMPHEYVHSWNGKFRRPEQLWQPDFETPERTRLLWVYEGLTDYLGPVLTARSGLWTPEQFRENLALVAANMDHRPGRTWRPLIDTTIAAQLLYGAPRYWANWRRGTDFYAEGTLIWLDVDTQIRALSDGRHSLDDFAQLFFGIDDGSYVTKTYTFDDIVNTLNKVQPYDWRSFLRDLVDRTQYHAPLAGITRSGWKLVYTDKPNPFQEAREARRHYLNLMFSIGMSVNDKGEIRDVLWDGPAFKAGIGPGMKIVSVNGVKFAPDVLKRAIAAARAGKEPLHFILDNDGYMKTRDVDYHDGLRYPHLVREKDRADYLGKILAPLKSS